MDELTIGDKIYISSKQAAKITGYAKDYVGQLCREGRVDARLVGRNWYVLESSIREHRFGPESAPQEQIAPVEEEKISPVTSWQAPTYEAIKEEAVLPPLESPKAPLANPDTSEAVALMQDAWKEWFETREKMQAEGPQQAEVAVEEATEEVEAPTQVNFDAVRVSDIPSNEAVFRVSQEDIDTESVQFTRVVEREAIEAYEPVETPTYASAPIRRYAEPRVAGSVIDLSQMQEESVHEPAIAPKKARRRRVRRRGSLTAQAIMLSIAGLAIVTAVIGSGVLDSAIAASGDGDGLRGSVFDIIRGESSVKK